MLNRAWTKTDENADRLHGSDPVSPATATRDPWQTTVLDLFQDSVRQFPGAIAVVDVSSSIAYRGLWNFAAAFRARLSALGVRPGDRVGIAAGRSLSTIAAILGVVMAGGCYVPVDPDEIPPEVFAHLAERNRLRCWIADETALRSEHAAALTRDPLLRLEDVSCSIGKEPVEIPFPQIDGESPLYVMFTSGSTGRPKGVVVPHRAVARLVTGQDFLAFGPEQTFLLHSPLSFDASTLELWGSLLHGGRLVVAPARPLGLEDYRTLLAAHGVTTLWLTAAIFHLAAEHQPRLFAPLRQLVFGGDVIAPRHVERVREMYPTLRMANGYGPTENTTFTCCYVVPENYRAGATLPIGRPLAHTTVQILDENLQEVKAGEEGELVTGGAGVALGYLDLPEFSAERFLSDPARAGGLRYRTGDRVRLRADGEMEFLGRRDRQVKIAGHRVEPSAVESVLAESSLVGDVAVVVLTSPSGEKQLAACVSLSRPTEDAEAQLRQWLRERVSRASMPQRWLFLERLPVNMNGKLDRAALRALFSVESERAPALETSGTEEFDRAATERFLEQLWASLLGRPVVGSEENFFDLGGTSLQLIEMHARLKARFPRVPSIVEMFALPTPRALAEHLHASGEQPRSAAAEVRGQRQRAALLARRSNLPIPIEEASR